MTATLALLMGPGEVDWSAAARVSIVGFLGVFVVLALLYLSTVAYGALARRMAKPDQGKKA